MAVFNRQTFYVWLIWAIFSLGLSAIQVGLGNYANAVWSGGTFFLFLEAAKESLREDSRS